MKISFDKNNAMLENNSGETIGRIELCAEESGSERTLSLQKKSSCGMIITDKKWQGEISYETLPENFFKIKLTISKRAGSGKLKRIYFRIEPDENTVNGIFSEGSLAFVLGNGFLNQDGVFALNKGRSYESSLVSVLYNPSSSSAFIAGIGAPSEDFSVFKVDKRSMEAGFKTAPQICGTRNYELVFGTGNEPFKLLDNYSEIIGKHARKKTEICTGWNTWDYYGGSVKMDDLRKEMLAINNSPLKGKLKYCVIDMGWECAWGDWQMNRKFPADFKSVASEISKQGLVPGLWFAPLQCSIFTDTGRYRQDLFIKSPSGSPEIFPQGVLFDFTLPDVQKILHEYFSMAREAGFKLFKLDYIYRDYLEKMACYSDSERGKAGVIREGIKTIRNAVGDNAHIINCGGPTESMIGLADSSRVSMDVHTFWGHIRHNASQIAVKLWQNGKLWSIDPDFAVMRCDETSNDIFPNYLYSKRPLKKNGAHWMAGPEASYTELNTLLVLTRITGGNVFLSDSIHRLNKNGIDALSKLFPPLKGKTTALDLFSNYKTAPRFWLNESGAKATLAIFNWEDKAESISIPAGINIPSSGRNFFSGKKISISEKTVMEPHSAFLLEI